MEPRLGLTEQQQQVMLRATAEFVAAAAAGREPLLDDWTLAGAAHLPLLGTFVSLKRGKHLRGCCGSVSGHVALLQGLQHSAERTVLDDHRFPAVSQCELEHLRLEVWLLHNLQPIHEVGEARADAVVTGGKHGLVVQRGGQSGLLLPGVAADHDWDAPRFLEQVCVKAGLHPSLWKDDDTRLSTFEGDVWQAPLAELCGAKPRISWWTPEQISAYAEFSRSNIIALMQGATPRYSFPGAPDGNVAGVILGVALADGERADLTKLSLRPGVAVQASLFQLAQSWAQQLLQAGWHPSHLSAVDVTLLYEPMLHGSAHDLELGGFDSRYRALVAFERNRQAIVFTPGAETHRVLDEACQLAHVMSRRTTTLFSLEAQSTADSVRISIAPKPIPGPAIRPPAVAGTFYPREAEELKALVDSLLPQTEMPKKRVVAAMVPHAGLRYSGAIAAEVLTQIDIPKTVVVIGPKHTALGVEAAVAPHETWSFPGGEIASDPSLAQVLSKEIAGLQLDAAAHQREHAIEVELPLLARLAPTSRVVGIVLGGGDLESCQQFADGLVRVLCSLPEPPLLLISSDMNHFATDAENRRLDALALEAMETLDPAQLYEVVSANHISMCGVLPAVVVMDALRKMNRLHRCERVGYATSADVTGDLSRVVGYAGVLLT